MDKTDTRFESRYGQSTQDRRQKVFTRGALGRLDIENSLKSPLIYSVSYSKLGALGVCVEGRSPPKHPRGAGTESAWAAN